jgi:hypothetical protein
VACASLVWLAYEVMFDSDSVNIASRLAVLSIDPEKWV